MLEVVLVWALMLGVSLFYGEWICRWVGHRLQLATAPNAWIEVWVGMVFVSMLATLLGLASALTPGVKLLAWLGLLAPIFYRYAWLPTKWSYFRQRIAEWGWISRLFFLSTAIIALAKSAGMPEIFDEGAYHMPLIRMWEQEGLIIGMANLNGHYGLNSIWHILNAFANLTFIPGWHTAMSLNGLVVVLLGLYAAQNVARLKQKPSVTRWVVAFMPVLVFRNVISSPATDIPAIIATWFLFTLWLQNLEDGHEWTFISPLLIILPFWVVMLKSSSAALMLIPLGLGIEALFRKRVRLVVVLAVAGLGLLLPWLFENWLLTGYLVFPVQFTSLFHPEWQVLPINIERKFYLDQFGMFAPPKAYTLTWLSAWFAAHNKDTRALLALAAMGVLLTVFWLNRRRALANPGYLLVATLAGTLTVWMLTITEPRYGFGGLVFAALFPLGWVALRLQAAMPKLYLGLWLVVAFQGFNVVKTLGEVRWQEVGIWAPAPRPKVAFRKLECRNFTGSTPTHYLSEVPEGKPPFCWDCPFPCVPKEGAMDSLHLESKTIFGRKAFVFR